MSTPTSRHLRSGRRNVVVVDQRFSWLGFVLALAGAFAASGSGAQPLGILLIVLAIAVIGLSILKPFPETDGYATFAGEYGPWLAPANAALLAGSFAVLIGSIIAFVVWAPVPFPASSFLSVWTALLSAWPWVFLLALAWYPRGSITRRSLVTKS